MTARRPFIALVLATVLSITGTRFSAIAIPWLVLTTTGSPVLTGLVGLAEMLPYVLAKGLGGPLIDRIGARRVSVWLDHGSAIAVAVVPLLFWAGLLSIWVLLPAVAVIGVLRAPSDASKQALVPAVAAMAGVPLERVAGLVSAGERLAGTLGAASAGLLIALLGEGAALLVNALGFLLSGVVLAAGVQHSAVVEETIDKPVSTYRQDFADGWHFMRRDAVLVGLVLMIAFTNLFDQAYSLVLLPVWVRTEGLDVTWVGILLAVFSGSAIAGSAMAAAWGDRLPRLLLYTVGFLCAGPLAMGVYAASLPLPVIIVVLLIGGTAAGFINPIISAILFERIPKPMVGRVVALVGALSWSLIPFGGLYAGLLVDGYGIGTALGITATLYGVATLTPLVVPSFREMNRKRVAPA